MGNSKTALSALRFSVAVGKHVGATDPASGEFKPQATFSYAKLVDLLTIHEARKNKDGRYITRPMSGDGKRSDANASAWRLVPLDVDELHASELQPLLRWCDESKLAGCLATTFSHRPDQPKVRIWLFASREIKTEEHVFVHQALSRLVPFKLDPCMTKPSQPAFLPACPKENLGEAFSKKMVGELLDIDKLLDGYREEMQEAQRKRAERAKGVSGTGVRQPGGLIDFFNQRFDLPELLEQHGYKRKTRNRYVAPSSKSGRAAVVLYDRSLISFHDPAHDPLASRNSLHQAMVLDTFAVYCKLEHADDFKAAFNGAAKWARIKGWDDSAAPSSAATAKTAAVVALPLTLLNPVDLYSCLKPQDMLVESILDQGSVVICSGDSNSGKTTILQFLALQVAQGTPFTTKRTKQGRALWIAGEDMENAKYRTVAMCEEYGVDPKVVGNMLLLLPQPVAILNEESMQSLREAVEQRVGAGAEFALIVVDSKSVNWGGADENSNDENAQFIGAVRRHLIEPFGRPAVLITHHLTKHREKESQSSRGGGALINNADHEWRFEMNQDARISAMMPGIKVRMERWPETRFLIRTSELPAAKFPQLANNFGEMPRVSIAEPVNQYNKSMRQLQIDSDLRATLLSLSRLTSAGEDCGLSHIAADLNWVDNSQKPDYRKVKRLLEYAQKQKLVTPNEDGKGVSLTEAGSAYAAQEVGNESNAPSPVSS